MFLHSTQGLRLWEEWISTPSLDLFRSIWVVPEVTEGFVAILNVSWPFFSCQSSVWNCHNSFSSTGWLNSLPRAVFFYTHSEPAVEKMHHLLTATASCRKYSIRLEARLVHIWGLYSAGLRRGPCPQSFLHLTTDPLHLTTTTLQPLTLTIILQ